MTVERPVRRLDTAARRVMREVGDLEMSMTKHLDAAPPPLLIQVDALLSASEQDIAKIRARLRGRSQAVARREHDDHRSQ